LDSAFDHGLDEIGSLELEIRAEPRFDDLGALCFLAFMIGLAIIFIAGKVSDSRG